MTDISDHNSTSEPDTAYSLKVTPVPHLIDDDFALQLSKRGQAEFSAFQKKHRLVVTSACVLGAMSIQPAFQPYLLLPFLLMMLCMVWLPFVKTRSLVRAFKANRHDVVARLLPNAHRLNAMWFPLTALQFRKTLLIKMQLLMAEGRFAELEAVVHYYWGATELKRSEFIGTPNNFFVANALAIACAQQNKFEQGRKIFSDLLSRAVDKPDRILLLTNLAHCLTHNGHLEEAAKVLEQAKEEIHNDTQSAAGLRLYMLEAHVLTQKNELEKAEELVEISSALAKKLREVPDAEAFCQDLMGQIKTRQNSLEEAKLYYQNSIDIMQSADNPNYLLLVDLTNRMGDMFAQASETALAEAQYLRARQIFDLYVEREKYALSLMRNRLTDPASTAFGGDLIRLAERIKYLDTIGP